MVVLDINQKRLKEYVRKSGGPKKLAKFPDFLYLLFPGFFVQWFVFVATFGEKKEGSKGLGDQSTFWCR